MRFTPHLPDGVPDVSRWEKATGSAELGEPRYLVEYELYVSPTRSGVYGLTRYRFSRVGAAQPASEKLQWDRDGRDVRRYECAPSDAAHRQPCQWRELPRGSAEYIGELGSLMSVYNLHVVLLRQRDDRR